MGEESPRQGSPGHRLRAFAHSLHVHNLFKCRLCWKIAFAVMVSIVAIEAAILIPSYQTHQSDLMDKLHAGGKAAVIAGFKFNSHGNDRDLLLAGKFLVMEGLLKGGSLYRSNGSLVGHFGETPHLTPALSARDKTTEFHQADGRRMELIWPQDQTGLPFTVIGRLDSSMVADEMMAYVIRVSGLVIIISLFVCIATMFALGKIILVPLLQLRSRLVEAGDDPANPENYTLRFDRSDEFGDVVDSFNNLLHLISRSQRSALAKSAMLLETTFENLSQGIAVYDADFRLIAFNSRFVELFEFPEGFIVLGRKFDEILRFNMEQGNVRPSTAEHGMETLLDSVRNKQSLRSETKLSNGTYLAMRRSPMPDGGFIVTFTDISKRKQAEEKLVRNSALLGTTLENMSHGIAVYDADHRLVAFNQKCVDLRDYPAGGLRLGMSVEDGIRQKAELGYYGPGDIDAIVADHLADKYQQTNDSLEVVNSDGKVVAFERAPMPDGGYVTTYTDITDRKHMEEELEKKSALLETMIESMSQGFCVYDSNQKLVACNQHFIDSMNLPASLAQPGTPREEIVRLIAKRGDYGPGDTESYVRERLAAVPRDGEMRYERAYPSGIVYSVRRTPMPGGGFVSTFTDITEQKQTEQELAEKSALLEATFENMVQAFGVYDADYKLVAFNEHLVDMFGYPPGFLRPGISHGEIIRWRAEQGHFGDGNIDELVKTRTGKSRNVARVDERSLPNGKVYVHHMKPMPGGGFVSTFTDITDRKRMEEDLRGAKEQAEFANRTKTEFLANMSHELRTPLNAVIGFSEVMMKESFGPIGNEKYAEYVGDIHSSGLHLLGLITDILDLSKIEAGKIELVEENFDPSEVINACVNMVRGQARSQGLELVMDIPDQIPQLHADQRALKQIIINLLSNAVKFTPEGGKITLKAWCQPTSGFILQVIDTGIGIALEDIPKVMQPFTQIDSTLSRKHQGTGLGLPLIKRLVELHGGSVDIQSELGAGTTVTVRLPAERIVAAKKIAKEAS